MNCSATAEAAGHAPGALKLKRSRPLDFYKAQNITVELKTLVHVSANATDMIQAAQWQRTRFIAHGGLQFAECHVAKLLYHRY